VPPDAVGLNPTQRRFLALQYGLWTVRIAVLTVAIGLLVVYGVIHL